ncbi:MAG: Fic family protein, partial [Pseudorhodoplanes sp.]|nr:Fic family protein [Pseudorhodoplanes sp.]
MTLEFARRGSEEQALAPTHASHEADEIDTLIRHTVTHDQFEAIHHFVDGNCRMCDLIEADTAKRQTGSAIHEGPHIRGHTRTHKERARNLQFQSRPTRA